jgi:PAS domain S-box-containing protein
MSLNFVMSVTQAFKFTGREGQLLQTGVCTVGRPSQPKRRVPVPLLTNPNYPILSSELLEALPDATVAVDRDGVMVQVNSQVQELFGYERDELVGQKVEILIPESYRSQHHQHRDAFAKTPKTRRMGADLDLYARRRDGSQFPVEISLSPVASHAGWFVLSAIRDISDRVRIAEELRRANEELHRRTAEQLGEYRSRLASIIDSSEDAILSKDLEGTITSWNKGAERIYGYKPEEVIGKSISILTPSDRPDEIGEILKKIKRGEVIEHYESVRLTKDGRHLNVSISVSPLVNAIGEIVGASAIARDITAQKHAESQLRQSQKMEAIGRLAGGVAHDFNNILAIINACTEFLRDRLDPAAEPSTYVENIRKATDRGASLTRQLLTFSRTPAIKTQILDLNDRLKEISKLLVPLLGDDVEVRIVSKSPSVIIEADPGQLDQIVVNLAVNARDAMPQGGAFILETSSVTLDDDFAAQHQAMIRGKYVLLGASDTGIGMDEATSCRIFEPFFTTKEIGKGTGLGLSTVYGIVKQNGGHVFVYSEPGHGTTFKIYLPSAEDKVGLPSQRPEEKVRPSRPGRTILLVEDDEIMRSITRKLLEEHGYRVFEANDGKSALDWAQANSESVDLLLTDVVMRNMSGPELAENLHRSHPNLNVIYMSGYTGELMANRNILKPGVTLLEKPFTRTALLNLVHTKVG